MHERVSTDDIPCRLKAPAGMAPDTSFHSALGGRAILRFDSSTEPKKSLPSSRPQRWEPGTKCIGPLSSRTSLMASHAVNTSLPGCHHVFQ